MNKIIAFVLKVTGFGWLYKRLDGYKTKIGAVSLILSGLAELTQKITALTDLASVIAFVRSLPTEAGWTAIAAGIAAWGLAHKMEKAVPVEPPKP